MLLPVVLFLLAVAYLDRRTRGPLTIFAFAWAVAIVPITTGVIHYNSLDDADYAYSLTLIGFLGCFVAGCGVYQLAPRTPLAPVDDAAVAAEFGRSWRIARIVWWVAIAGSGFAIVDFALLGGEGLSDLASLRDTIVERKSASIFAQLSSVLTWGCLYCYIFALAYRTRLRRAQFATMIVPIAGYFLLSVVSAGRQAAFQIILVTVLTLFAVAARTRTTRAAPRVAARPRSSRGLVLVVVAMMGGYMGFIAVARSTSPTNEIKADILTTLFDFRLAEPVARGLAALPDGIRSAVVEGLVYFTHSIWLFEKFLGLSWPQLYYGGFTFPFAFRQIQGFTGLSPVQGLADRVTTIDAAGYIGAGWVTAIASFIQDAGVPGAAAILFAIGYYSASVWRRAVGGTGFHLLVIAVLVATTIVYLPLVPATSDTNLFLLWLFAIVGGHRWVRRPAAPRVAHVATA